MHGRIFNLFASAPCSNVRPSPLPFVTLSTVKISKIMDHCRITSQDFRYQQHQTWDS